MSEAFGKVNFISPTQLLKAYSLIQIIVFGIKTSVSFEQPSNMCSLMVVMLVLTMFGSSRLIHPAKAYFPMSVIALCNVNACKFTQP